MLMLFISITTLFLGGVHWLAAHFDLLKTYRISRRSCPRIKFERLLWGQIEQGKSLNSYRCALKYGFAGKSVYFKTSILPFIYRYYEVPKDRFVFKRENGNDYRNDSHFFILAEPERLTCCFDSRFLLDFRRSSHDKS